MTEYEYRRKILEGVVGVDPEEGVTVDLPEDAVGITLRSFSDDIWVRYLVPVDSVATDGGRTIVGDPSHPAETHSPTDGGGA